MSFGVLVLVIRRMVVFFIEMGKFGRNRLGSWELSCFSYVELKNIC